jgi:TRAP-type C4-dicarboxylate transport system substrate-binding protein
MSDLSGMKIRVSNDPVMRGMVQALGASPTVVNYNELYSALQTGVVDAAEQPIANYKSKAFNEVAPYMILDGHTLGAIQVIITDEAWDKLSANQQNALVEAGKIASAFNRELSEGAENEVLKALAAEGTTVIPVDDKTPWQKACAAVIEKSSANNTALYQQILDMQ